MRGTLNPKTFFATFYLVNAIVNVAKNNGITVICDDFEIDGKEELTKLKVILPLDLIDVITINATLDCTHDIQRTDIDFSEVTNLVDEEYSFLG